MKQSPYLWLQPLSLQPPLLRFDGLVWDAPVLLCCGEDVPQRGHEVRRAVAEEPRQVDLHVARVQRLHGGMR